MFSLDLHRGSFFFSYRSHLLIGAIFTQLWCRLGTKFIHYTADCEDHWTSISLSLAPSRCRRWIRTSWTPSPSHCCVVRADGHKGSLLLVAQTAHTTSKAVIHSDVMFLIESAVCFLNFLLLSWVSISECCFVFWKITRRSSD